MGNQTRCILHPTGLVYDAKCICFFVSVSDASSGREFVGGIHGGRSGYSRRTVLRSLNTMYSIMFKIAFDLSHLILSRFLPCPGPRSCTSTYRAPRDTEPHHAIRGR